MLKIYKMDHSPEQIIDRVIEKITLKRKQKNYSNEFMADKLEISPAAYYKIESKTTKLSVERLLRISDILKISLIELFEIGPGNVYNQEFKDQSANQNQEFRDNSANQLTQNIYNDNKALTDRYINRLEEEIESLKAKIQSQESGD